MRASEVTVIDEPDALWERAEAELMLAGIPLPMRSRLAWVLTRPEARHWLLVARDDEGRPKGALVLEALKSRALPGHWILRAERIGASVPPNTERPLFSQLLRCARADGRILRVAVELFTPDSSRRAELAQVLADLGWQSTAARSYTVTLAVDLRKSEEDVLASFSKKTRRDLAAAERQPLEVSAIVDPDYADRIDNLHQLTMARTGGVYRPENWAAYIELSRAYPELSRVVGMFRKDVKGPEGLVAFAWGCHDGDHAHYDAAGSIRAPDLKLPLAYPLLWDLIRWARSAGAPWFDLGGVTLGSAGSSDPLGGISDFKRWFSKEVVEVGEEWQSDVHFVRSRVANAVGSAAALVRDARFRIRPK